MGELRLCAHHGCLIPLICRSAAALGVPFLPASLANSSDDDDARGRGVNFAVGGATAVDVAFFERRRLVPFKLLNNSLDVQLGWFEELEPSLCNATAESMYAAASHIVPY
jgi:hypothetical protein